MDYSKYLHCAECQKSGLYCNKHRIEVETMLRKREIRKLLQMPSHQSAEYRHRGFFVNFLKISRKLLRV